jgi:hypothetical protein
MIISGSKPDHDHQSAGKQAGGPVRGRKGTRFALQSPIIGANGRGRRQRPLKQPLPSKRWLHIQGGAGAPASSIATRCCMLHLELPRRTATHS